MAKKRKSAQPVVQEKLPAKPRPRHSLIPLVLILTALSVSIYLLKLHFDLVSGDPSPNVCSAVFGVDCEDALKSDYAVQLGVPLGGWGIIYFSTLLAILLLGRYLGEVFDVQATVFAFLFSIPAAFIGLLLMGTMLSGRTGFCPFCAAIHILNFALVFFLWRQTGQSIPGILAAVVSPANPQQSPSIISERRVRMLAILAALLVGISSFFAVRSFSKQDSLAPVSANSLDTVNVLQRELPGSDTESAAPVVLQVYSDFQCPACRDYASQIEQMRKQYSEDQVEIVFRHFPLDQSCNSLVTRPMHVRACEAAYAAEAARVQGKFWEYHDELFFSDLMGNVNIFTALAKTVGLDMQRFEQDRQSNKVKGRVHDDIRRGLALDVNATPTLFLNGQRLLDKSPEVVRRLIGEALQQKKPAQN